MAKRRIVILGSTGSIGVQALDVIAAHRTVFQVVGLVAAGSDPRLLAAQALDHRVSVLGVVQASAASDVQRALDAEAQRRGFSAGDDELPTMVVGPNAAAEIAAVPCDVVLNAISGAAGLEPTLAALQAGATLALANKESLIIGGPLVQRIATPDQIVPVDSEHSALAQCLRSGDGAEVSRLVLTASGGPFRGWSPGELETVTPEQALAHPTWQMGPLVTVNSASLVNKGLEVIEAHMLFGIPLDRIDVVIHPQSVVHSMVEFHDGSTIVQASPPDMRIPIALGLDWPHRHAGIAPACDWSQAVTWNFEPVDEQTFPAIALARRAGSAGGTAPAVFNAADEVGVAAFLAGELGFPGIVQTIAAVLNEHIMATGSPGGWCAAEGLDDVLSADAWARTRAAEIIATAKP